MEILEKASEAISQLEDRDYAFSVETTRGPYDVYRVRVDGERGMIGIRVIEESYVEVGFFKRGRHATPAEVINFINESDA